MIVRIGDRVRIVEPEIFVRCGYPFDQRAEAQHIAKTHGDKLRIMIDHVFDPSGARGVYGRDFDFDRLCERLAHIVAVRHDYGGNTRAIFTRTDEMFRGVECLVTGKRVCKTGERYGPSGGQGWDGDWEYEPGGLADEKTHVILEVQPIYNPERTHFYTLVDFEIERCHVEKVT